MILMTSVNARFQELWTTFAKKIAGDEYNYRKRQLFCELWKGCDELLKMTSRHHLKPPITFVLLTHIMNMEHHFLEQCYWYYIPLKILWMNHLFTTLTHQSGATSFTGTTLIGKKHALWIKSSGSKLFQKFLVILCIGGDSLVSIASVV
jgi:hypothetical protein